MLPVVGFITTWQYVKYIEILFANVLFDWLIHFHSWCCHDFSGACCSSQTVCCFLKARGSTAAVLLLLHPAWHGKLRQEHLAHSGFGGKCGGGTRVLIVVAPVGPCCRTCDRNSGGLEEKSGCSIICINICNYICLFFIYCILYSYKRQCDISRMC